MGWRQSAFNEIPICARGTNPRRTISKNGLALLVRKFLKGTLFFGGFRSEPHFRMVAGHFLQVY